jgi:hypothetical protein
MKGSSCIFQAKVMQIMGRDSQVKAHKSHLLSSIPAQEVAMKISLMG